MKSVKSVRNIMKKSSLTLLTLSACSMSSVLTSDAAAALATYSNFGYWQSDVTATGDSVATETFNSYNGYYTSLSGTTGGIAWNADASGGIFIGHISSGLFSTNVAGATATFTFSPGVLSVGGNIFGTNIGFEYVEARITVVLSDGSSYIGRTTGPADFVGFISNGAEISSLTLSATGLTPGVTYVTMDNLYLGVPGPSSLALLACAGLTAARRRRS
jgi:hypothetical protein